MPFWDHDFLDAEEFADLDPLRSRLTKKGGDRRRLLLHAAALVASRGLPGRRPLPTPGGSMPGTPRSLGLKGARTSGDGDGRRRCWHVGRRKEQFEHESVGLRLNDQPPIPSMGQEHASESARCPQDLRVARPTSQQRQFSRQAGDWAPTAVEETPLEAHRQAEEPSGRPRRPGPRESPSEPARAISGGMIWSTLARTPDYRCSILSMSCHLDKGPLVFGPARDRNTDRLAAIEIGLQDPENG